MTGTGCSSVAHQHVAVFAFPFATHAAPLLTLVCRLSAAAPNVKFSFFNTARSNASIFPDAINGFGNVKPYNISDGIPQGHVLSRNPKEAIELFLKATPHNFKKYMDVAVAETGMKITCLVTDAFLWFGGVIAEEMHVPWVPLWTAGPWSISTHIYTDEIRQRIGVSGISGQEDQTLDFIPGLSAIRPGDLPEGVIFGDLESCFSSMLHNMGRMLPRAAAVAINSYEELDDTVTKDLMSKLLNFLNIGPFTLTSPPPLHSDDHGCLAWLDKQGAASVAYISFGSVITPPPHELAAIAEALEEKKIPFLWSFRGNIEQELPNAFLQRTASFGMIVPWAPQTRILEHASIGVFVTHCGWNSLMESITGGVPMICRPFFGDQSLNRRVVEDVWKIGMGVDDEVFTKSGTMKALELILLNDKGKEMRETAGVLKQHALKAVGSDGSSVKNFITLLGVVTTSNDTCG